jgi:hypothetical protein
MKVFLGIISGFIFVFGTLVVALLLRPPTVFISPDGQFKIELYGNMERPEVPFLSTDLTADVFVNGQKLERTYIYPSGDFFESSFDSVYRDLSWDSENVFGFHRNSRSKIASEEDGDSLTVSNKTDRTIGFLNIMFGGNRYLLMNLGSKSSQSIYVRNSMYNEYIDVSGVFSDRTKIEGDGKNFTETSKYKNKRLFRYCATVENDRVRVNSVDLDGYSTIGTNREALRVRACGE